MGAQGDRLFNAGGVVRFWLVTGLVIGLPVWWLHLIYDVPRLERERAIQARTYYSPPLNYQWVPEGERELQGLSYQELREWALYYRSELERYQD